MGKINSAAIAVVLIAVLSYIHLFSEPKVIGTVRFERPEYSFGVLSPNNPQTATLIIRNDTNTPVTITEIRPSCSCTDASIADARIGVGGNAKVNVTVHTMGKQGAISVEIIAVYNDSTQKYLTTHIEGWVSPAAAIMVSPDKLEVTDRTPLNLQVTGPASVMKLLKVSTSDGLILTEVGQIKEIQPEMGIDEVGITVMNKFTSRVPQETKLVVASGYGLVVVPIYWVPLEKFSFVPNQMFIGIIEPNKVATENFFLRHTAKIIAVPSNIKISKTNETDGSYDKYTLKLSDESRANEIISKPIMIEDDDQLKKLWISWWQRSPRQASATL